MQFMNVETWSVTMDFLTSRYKSFQYYGVTNKKEEAFLH